MPSFEYPQFWDDLTKKQAVEIFDAYVGEHPQRVAAAIDYLKGLGLSDEVLDFSNVSLEPVWVAVLNDVQIPAQASEDWERSDMPPFAAFRPGPARRVGPVVVDIIGNVAAYFCECVLRADERATFTLGEHKNGVGHRMPLLVFPSGADLSAESLVDKTLMRALEGTGPNAAKDAAPDGLRRHMDMRLQVSAPAPRPERSVFEIHTDDASRFHVTYNEEVDEDTSRSLDRLVEQLRTHPDIDAVEREDRDILLIQSELNVDVLEQQLTTAYRDLP